MQEEGFDFPLLTDPDRSVSGLYDAKKGEDEKWSDWPRRVSYLVTPDGKIARSYKVDDVGTHPEQVLKDLEELVSG